jgi:tetratricopeptide (TPR) repeat protein
MTAAVRPFALAVLAVGLLMFTNACAPKVTTPAPVAASPRFPDFVFPDPPSGLGTPATVERHKAGWQWLQAGDFRAADRNFAASLKLSPNFYPAEVGLGYSALARKETDSALTHFDRAVVENPRYAPALVGRGDALLASGQRDVALQSFEAALAADPNLAALRSRIEVLRFRGLQDDVADARKMAEAGRLPEARKLYQQAIAASPQSPFLYRELALVERRDGDLAAALVHAQKASELEPSDARALVLIGEILEARDEGDAAIKAYTSAIALEPSETIEARIKALRDKAALTTLPDEYKTIDTSPTVSRAQLAALIGVRLGPVLKLAGGGTAVVMTDTRSTWAAPWILTVTQAGVMEVYPNHTFQPSAQIRRVELARAASNVLSIIGRGNPAMAGKWREAANRQRFRDVMPTNPNYAIVSLVVEAGVMAAGPDGAFQPSRYATGAEAVAAVRKLQDVAEASRPR